MNAITNCNRRSALKAIGAAGGLVLGTRLVPGTFKFASAAGETTLAPNVFVAIAKDGTVTLFAHRSEMGQGIRTGLSMILADELEADWKRVKVEQADGDAKYGDQYTDGSRSIVKNFQRMREFGAAARQLLEQAAAKQWGVDAADCKAQNHKVVHAASGKSLDYGELVEIAAGLPVPAPETLRLKDPKEFRYIGKEVPIVDLPNMMVGAAKYTIDISLPGMKYASVERCPVVLGKFTKYDAAETLKVPGVERVVEIPSPTKPVMFKPLGGIAVVATNSWAAMEGRRKLKVEWDLGENAGYDTASARKEMETTASKPGDRFRNSGDAEAALAAGGKTLEATYYTPHFAHAPMEPPGAVANVQGDKVEVWSSTQDGQAAQAVVAEALGIDKAKVISHVPLLGGAFGRKSKPDFAAEAALISREIGAPVKVTWMREDDIRHGYYHSSSVQYVKAAVDDRGKATAWLHRSVFPPITSIFKADAAKPDSWELDFGLSDLPYDIPNIALENGPAPAHVRIGWMRSVQNVFHAFAISSFADELAQAAGRDSVEHLLELIGPPRKVDLAAAGVKQYFNYDNSTEIYPIDTGRLANVIKLVAEKAGWGKQLPKGQGLGIAAHRAFLTYVATVVHVDVSKDGKVTIPRLDMAVDAGTVVNPDRVRAQMEGANIYAMSSARFGEITAKEGRIEQGNFDDYLVARIGDAPRETHVHLVESTAPPGGVGEPGVPPFAPALCNAIFAATGKRVRSLPISHHDLSWT
jgi:isoquinoline 1-oxidoreductase beta subunit